MRAPANRNAGKTVGLPRTLQNFLGKTTLAYHVKIDLSQCRTMAAEDVARRDRAGNVELGLCVNIETQLVSVAVLKAAPVRFL